MSCYDGHKRTDTANLEYEKQMIMTVLSPYRVDGKSLNISRDS